MWSLLLLFTLATGVPARPRLSLTSGNSENCEDCRLAMRVVHSVFGLSFTQEKIVELVSFLCAKFKIETSAVCSGISSEFKAEVLYVINEQIFEPAQLCPILFADCGEPRLPYYDWNVSLPDVPKPPVTPPVVPPVSFHATPSWGPSPPPNTFMTQVFQKGSETLRILHLSDLHIDWFYQVGAEAKCKDPVCCRLTIEGSPKQAAGQWGTVGRCEIPLHSVEKIFEYISANEQFDFIYWTGDLPTHSVWNQTREGQLEKLGLLTQLLNRYFPGKYVFSAVGNHESAPVDSFPMSIPSIPMKYRSSWLYDYLSQQWTQFLPQPDEQVYIDIQTRASFATQVRPGLRVISINRNYCDNHNYWLYLNQTDPDGVLTWFAEELQKAETAGDKVHVLGHEHTCAKEWKSSDINFKRIVNRYESTIAGMFFGHTHKDEFKVFFDMTNPESPRPTSVMHIVGAITTYASQTDHAHNPSYKIYTVDARQGGTFGVLDYESKYVDITESNEKSASSPIVKFQYNASSVYGIDALFPTKMFDVYQRMTTDDSLFHKYLTFVYSSWQPSVDACDAKCKRKLKNSIADQLPHNKTETLLD